MTNSLVAIAVMFLWAICFPLLTVGLEYSSPLLFATLRASIAGIFLVLLGGLLKKPPIRGYSNWLSIVFVGFTATSLGFWGMFHAASLVSPGLATVLTNAQPLIAVPFAWVFLAERPKRIAISGIALGFFGIVIISADSIAGRGDTVLKGFIYILVAATGIAISNIILKKMSGKVDRYYAMGWQLLIGAVPLGVMSFWIEFPPQLEVTPGFVLSLMAVSLFGTSLVFVLWFWLLDRMPLYRANAYSFLTPVLGMVLGATFYSESFSVIKLAGIITIIAGIYLVNTKPNLPVVHRV